MNTIFNQALASMITNEEKNSPSEFSINQSLEGAKFNKIRYAIVGIRYHKGKIVKQELETNAITEELAKQLGEKGKNESLKVVVSSLDTKGGYIFMVMVLGFD